MAPPVPAAPAGQAAAASPAPVRVPLWKRPIVWLVVGLVILIGCLIAYFVPRLRRSMTAFGIAGVLLVIRGTLFNVTGISAMPFGRAARKAMMKSAAPSSSNKVKAS